MKWSSVFALVLTAVAAAEGPTPASPVQYDAEIIAIEGVRLFDGTGQPVSTDQTVLIRDGRITEIGQELTIPEAAQRIDGEGHTLMPGLVMVHEHLFYLSDPDDFEDPVANDAAAILYFSGGVTTARTAGSHHPSVDIQLKKQIDLGLRLGPELEVTVYLMGTKPMIAQATGLGFEDTDQIRKAVRHWAARGAGSIKLFMSLPPELAQAASEEANAIGLGIAGHLCATGAREAVGFGLDTLEHGFLSAHDLAHGFAPGECSFESFMSLIKLLTEAEPDSPGIRDLQQLMLAEDVAITPTFASLAIDLCDGFKLSDEALAVVTDRVRKEYRSHLGACDDRVESGAAGRARAFEQALGELALAYHRAGGRVLAGSDAANAGLVPGFSNHRELERFVQHGFTPVETLVIATRTGAEQLDLLADRGTIEVGKRADLLLVAGNPDQSISDIRNIKIVFKAGVGYDPVALRESVPNSIE